MREIEGEMDIRETEEGRENTTKDHQFMIKSRRYLMEYLDHCK